MLSQENSVQKVRIMTQKTLGGSPQVSRPFFDIWSWNHQLKQKLSCDVGGPLESGGACEALLVWMHQVLQRQLITHGMLGSNDKHTWSSKAIHSMMQSKNLLGENDSHGFVFAAVWAFCAKVSKPSTIDPWLMKINTANCMMFIFKVIQCRFSYAKSIGYLEEWGKTRKAEGARTLTDVLTTKKEYFNLSGCVFEESLFFISDSSGSAAVRGQTKGQMSEPQCH